MATLSKIYNDIRREIGWFIGQSREPEQWDPALERNVRDVLAAGLSNFYWYVPPDGQERHSWSFLKPSATLPLVASTDTYDLPTDFGGLYSDGFTFDSGTQPPIKLVTEEELRTIRGTEAKTATHPSYCAIRPKVTHDGHEQIYEITFYPNPTASHTLRYRYSIIPGLIDETNQYPYGSRLHSVTILESCLAVAQRKFMDAEESGVNHDAEFQKALMASVYRDKEFSDGATDTSLWPIENTSGDLALDRSGLLKRLGHHMFQKPNAGSWSYDEKNRLEQVLVTGLSNFYWYTSPGEGGSHSWSFLNPSSTLDIIASKDTYDLPKDFRVLYSDGFTFGSGPQAPIKLVTEEELRTVQGTLGESATSPQYCAIRPKMTSDGLEQSNEVLFYPSPLAAHTLRYRYSVIPGFIDGERSFPYGAKIHSVTILESCLAAADQFLGSSGPHEAEFQKCLAASVERDQQFPAMTESVHIWPKDETPEGLTLNRSALLQRIAQVGFDKPNPGSWTHNEKSRLEQVLFTGLSNFYWPVPPEGNEGHSWSFLKPTSTLSLVASTDTYNLPPDFGGLDTDGFTFESGTQAPIQLVSEDELRSVRGTLSKTDTPSYCAIRPKAAREGFEQGYEVLFYPKPAAAHTLRYRYSLIPGYINDKNAFPYGSRLHSITILESCLAAAQREFSGADAEVNHEAEFQRHLAASFYRDREFSGVALIAPLWPIEDDATSLSLDRAGLRQRIGNHLFNKPNIGSWSHDEAKRVEQVLVTGLSSFYWYSPSDGAAQHSWSFLKPSATFEIVSDKDTYEFPSDFGGIDSGGFTFESGNKTPVRLVCEEELRAIKSTLSQEASEPQYCAIRPKAASEGFEQTYEAIFYPSPTAANTLRYRYSVIPGLVDNTDIYPYGSRLHSVTILESCLAAADQLNGDADGAHEAKFQKSLAASIARDQGISDETATAHMWPMDEMPTDLALDRSRLRQRIGFLCFKKPNVGSWTHDEQSVVEQILVNGLSNFYWYTTQGEGESHTWSFLRPSAKLSLLANTDTYNLPVDFGGLDSGEFTFDSGTANPIKLVGEEELRAVRGTLSQTATEPSYCAIRPRRSSDGFEQVHEVVFYPKPTAAHTLGYRYSVIPGFVDDENIYPLGSRLYSMAILESCLASAQRELGLEGSVDHEAEFQKCLTAAIRRDQKFLAISITGHVWPVEAPPASLSHDRGGLLKRLGHHVFDKPNAGSWSHDEESRLQQILVTGLSNFYWFTPIAGAEGHDWSFLSPSATLAITASTDSYNLPADFGGLESDGFTFDSGTQSPIKLVTEGELQTLRGTLAQTAAEPSYCAIRPKVNSPGAEQLYEVLFYPKPTSGHTLRYRYSVIPGFIDEANPYPYGSRLHSITILESCLAAADEFLGKTGPHDAEFQRCLAASIHRDKKFPDRILGSHIWPIEETQEDLTLNRKGLMRRVGHTMLAKPNPGAWSHDEKSQVEQVVMDGLRKFYYPMIMPNEREMHRWGFLYPKQTFNCVGSQYVYELPEDFGAFMGPMHYSPGSAVLYPHVEEVSESQIEQLRQGGDHTGRTRYFAVRPMLHGEFKGTRYEMLLYPVPDQAYTLHYRYEVNPKFIVQDQEYPLGGQPHSQTILEACLLSADLFRNVARSPHELEYMKCLQASISYDRQLTSPDTLGTDYDGSDRPSDAFSDIHDADLNLVTYTGYSP